MSTSEPEIVFREVNWTQHPSCFREINWDQGASRIRYSGGNANITVPQVRPLHTSMSQERRSASLQFIVDWVELCLDVCSAAVVETGVHIGKARDELYHRLAEHRRHKLCTRAEANDIALAPSRRLDVTQRNQNESGLLKLPTELRIQIYEYIYTPAATIQIADKRSRGKTFHLTARMMQPGLQHDRSCENAESSCSCFVRRVGFALPLTCRQLYSETIHYLYSTLGFRFIDNRLILALPNTIPFKHFRYITALDLSFDVDPLVESYHLPSLLQHKRLATHFGRAALRRRKTYINSWHFIRTTLPKLQSLLVQFYRHIYPSAADHALEQKLCEWFLAPLFQRPDDTSDSLWSSELKTFEVRLGPFWFLHEDSEDTSFVKAVVARKPPFRLRRACDCGHDFRYCIWFHLPD